MTIDLGTDLATLPDGGLNPNLDLLVSGAPLVVQDLRAELLTFAGQLFYDESYGLRVTRVAARVTDARRAELAAAVEAVCLRDDRVAFVEVTVTGALRIEVEGQTSSNEPFRFVVDPSAAPARLSETP